MRSDRIFCQHGPSPSNSSWHGPHHKCTRRANETGDVHDNYTDDDDGSFNLEDLMPGGKCDRAVPSFDADDDIDEDSSIESSLQEVEVHDGVDWDDDNEDYEGGNTGTNSSALSSGKGTIQDALTAQHQSTSKTRHREDRFDKRAKGQSLHSSMSEIANNKCEINDFDVSSSCLSFEYEEDVKDNHNDPNGDSDDGADGTMKPKKTDLLLLTPVLFSAGKGRHRESCNLGGGARAEFPVTPMSRITEHTCESAYNSSDFEDVSPSALGRVQSNYRGGDGRSSIATSANNSFDSSKMSSRRFDAFSHSPQCRASGRGTWATTIKRCDILNIQDLQSLMLAPDE